MTMYYRFEDGYELWTVGRLDRTSKMAEVRRHGKVVVEQRA